MENEPITAYSQGKAKEKSKILLAPGELVCDWLKVKDHDSRMLLRMFVNLSVYGKIAVILMLIIMGVGG